MFDSSDEEESNQRGISVHDLRTLDDEYDIVEEVVSQNVEPSSIHDEFEEEEEIVPDAPWQPVDSDWQQDVPPVHPEWAQDVPDAPWQPVDTEWEQDEDLVRNLQPADFIREEDLQPAIAEFITENSPSEQNDSEDDDFIADLTGDEDDGEVEGEVHRQRLGATVRGGRIVSQGLRVRGGVANQVPGARGLGGARGARGARGPGGARGARGSRGTRPPTLHVGRGRARGRAGLGRGRVRGYVPGRGRGRGRGRGGGQGRPDGDGDPDAGGDD